MIGNFIKSLRKQKALSQAEVAKYIKVSRPTYYAIENNERDINLKEIKKLSELFDVSLIELMEGKKERKHGPELKKFFVEDRKPTSQARKRSDIHIPKKNMKKFKQVLLYILSEVGGKPNVGETVLHKLLYFIDFDYYEKFQETLMGAVYIRNHHGPTAIDLNAVLKTMQEKGEIQKLEKKFHGFSQKKYIPLKKADLSLLSARDIKHIDGVLNRLSDKTAKDIERYSHGDIPWIATKEGEKIDYRKVFYRDEKYSVGHYDDEI